MLLHWRLYKLQFDGLRWYPCNVQDGYSSYGYTDIKMYMEVFVGTIQTDLLLKPMTNFGNNYGLTINNIGTRQ